MGQKYKYLGQSLDLKNQYGSLGTGGRGVLRVKEESTKKK